MLKRRVCYLISRGKKIRTEQLDLPAHLHQALGFATLDLVTIMLVPQKVLVS